MNNPFPLSTLWLRIPEKYRFEIVSAFHTFITAVGIQLLIELQARNFMLSFDKTVLISIAAAALRAGVKAITAAVLAWRKSGYTGDTN